MLSRPIPVGINSSYVINKTPDRWIVILSYIKVFSIYLKNKLPCDGVPNTLKVNMLYAAVGGSIFLFIHKQCDAMKTKDTEYLENEWIVVKMQEQVDFCSKGNTFLGFLSYSQLSNVTPIHHFTVVNII